MSRIGHAVLNAISLGGPTTRGSLSVTGEQACALKPRVRTNRKPHQHWSLVCAQHLCSATGGRSLPEGPIPRPRLPYVGTDQLCGPFRLAFCLGRKVALVGLEGALRAWRCLFRTASCDFTTAYSCRERAAQAVSTPNRSLQPVGPFPNTFSFTHWPL